MVKERDLTYRIVVVSQVADWIGADSYWGCWGKLACCGGLLDYTKPILTQTSINLFASPFHFHLVIMSVWVCINCDAEIMRHLVTGENIKSQNNITLERVLFCGTSNMSNLRSIGRGFPNSQPPYLKQNNTSCVSGIQKYKTTVRNVFLFTEKYK